MHQLLTDLQIFGATFQVETLFHPPNLFALLLKK